MGEKQAADNKNESSKDQKARREEPPLEYPLEESLARQVGQGTSMPDHSTTYALRQKAILQMQRQHGNRYTRRILGRQVQSGAKGDPVKEEFNRTRPGQRNPESGQAPSIQSKSQPSTLLSQTVIQRDRRAAAATAARRLPSGIDFGQTMGGDGFRMNPRFWNLGYYLKRGRARRHFGSWPETARYLEQHPTWQDSATTCIIRFRPNGDAHRALNDLFNPDSADMYAFDCYTAAALIQFEALHQEYVRANRIDDFNERYGNTLFNTEGRWRGVFESLDLEEVDLGRDIPLGEVPAGQRSRVLRQGDWVYIKNTFIHSGPWQGENATYLGRGHFSGHPIGTFTARQYAQYLLTNVTPGMAISTGGGGVDEAFILSRSRIDSTVRRAAHRGIPPLTMEQSERND
ncbi:MAG: hypothetical protein R3300_19065 [Candidatus Promineifilaceae bacterium]|nr:hypothetical protein [Candidatus Promineifilaceae bacterium]